MGHSHRIPTRPSGFRGRYLAAERAGSRVIYELPDGFPARPTRADLETRAKPVAVRTYGEWRPFERGSAYDVRGKRATKWLESVRVVDADAPAAAPVRVVYVLPAKAWRDLLGAHQRAQIARYARPDQPEDGDARIELGPVDRDGAAAGVILEIAATAGVQLREVVCG